MRSHRCPYWTRKYGSSSLALVVAQEGSRRTWAVRNGNTPRHPGNPSSLRGCWCRMGNSRRPEGVSLDFDIFGPERCSCRRVRKPNFSYRTTGNAPVLDAVLRSSREVFPLNIFPVTAQTLRGFDKGIVFYFQPFTAVKVWVQGLLPSLRAFYHHGQRHAGGTSKLLLTIGTPGSYAGCDQCPLLAILLHAHDEQLVLALGPLPFFEPTGHRVMPSFPTVFVGPAGELVCDATPISHITTVYCGQINNRHGRRLAGGVTYAGLPLLDVALDLPLVSTFEAGDWRIPLSGRQCQRRWRGCDWRKGDVA